MVARVAAGDADIAGRRVTVHAPPSAFVMGDADSLRRVVDNLIDNAFKYGVPPVDVTIELHEDGVGEYGGEVVLSVVDHGPGIDAGDRDRIFDRFQRLEVPSRRPASGWGCRSCVAWWPPARAVSWWRTRRAAARPSAWPSPFECRSGRRSRWRSDRGC